MMKKRLGGLGLGSLKLIHRGTSHKDVKNPPVSIDWLEDDADGPLSPSPLFINRPPPLEPVVEHELRKACAIILQGLRPSGYDIEDTRMKSDELLDMNDDDPLDYNNARTAKSIPAQHPGRRQQQQRPLNGQVRPQEPPKPAAVESSKHANSSAAWVMDRNGDDVAPVNPHDFVLKPEPPARSARRPQRVDSHDGDHEDPDKIKRRSLQRRVSDLPQELASPHATREAKETLHVPAPSASNISPSAAEPPPPIASIRSPRSFTDDNSSHYSRSSDHPDSASTNLTSAPLTPAQAKSGSTDQSNKWATSPLPPVDADQINQIQTAMTRRLRAQEAEMESHTTAARAVVLPSRSKDRADASIIASSENQKPVIVSHRPGSRSKSLTLSSQAAAQSISNQPQATGRDESRSQSQSSHYEGDSEPKRRAGSNGQILVNGDSKATVPRSGSGDSLDRSAKGATNIPPVPPLHEGRRANHENSTFFRNSDGSLDGSFAKSKDQKLQGIKDKSEEPLQTARARIAANNSNRNSTTASHGPNQPSQSSKASVSQTQSTSRQGAIKSSSTAQPQSILKSPTHSTFSISSQTSKHHDDESIMVKDFWKPSLGGRGPQKYGTNSARPRDGRRTDPAAADFDQLMSVMKDNKEVEPRREYQPEIYNNSLTEEPEDEEEPEPPQPRKVNGTSVTILDTSTSSSRGPISPSSLPKSPNTPSFLVNGINGSHSSQSRTQSLTYSRTQSLLSNASQRIATAVAGSQEGHRKSSSSPHGQSPYRVVSPTRSSLSGASPSLYNSAESRKQSNGGVRKLFSRFGVGEKKGTWMAPPAPSTIAIWEREMAEEEDPDWDEEACAAPVVGFGKGW